MTKKHIKAPYKKIALALSLAALIIWGILGTSASLAWFSDTSEEINNIFHAADFELEVSHRNKNGEWETIDSQSDIFDNQALYEPGYVQVVYLKIENKGDRAFDFKAAVSVTDYTVATNYFGQQFNLQDHLKFGAVFANTVAELDQAVETRDLAKAIATSKLSNYWHEDASLNPNETMYMALVVRMGEEVGNEANYRGDTIPTVELGIIVNATQKIN